MKTAKICKHKIQNTSLILYILRCHTAQKYQRLCDFSHNMQPYMVAQKYQRLCDFSHNMQPYMVALHIDEWTADDPDQQMTTKP